MKSYSLLCLTLSIGISSHAAIDVYPNPNLIDPSLATTFASQLRHMKIKQMEQVIEGECNQFKEYTYLSIQNWEDLKRQRKSFDEAQQTSRQLIREIPYRLSFQYTFPLGIGVYSITEEYIKSTTLYSENFEKYKFINQIYDSCIVMNNTKYFELLTNTKYLTGNQKPFVSESEVLKNFDPSNSAFKSIHLVPSERDKLTPPNMAKSINFTNIEFGIAYVFIDDTIKNGFLQSDIRWIDYKKVSRDMQMNFKQFMEKGGRNQDFALMATIVKMISPQLINKNNVPPVREEIQSAISNFGSETDPVLEKKLKDTFKKFNY